MPNAFDIADAFGSANDDREYNDYLGGYVNADVPHAADESEASFLVRFTPAVEDEYGFLDGEEEEEYRVVVTRIN